MAADKTTNKDFTIRRHNGESYDALLPTTHMGQVYTDNTLTTTLDEHLTNVYAPITAIDELEDKKADKTALAATETMLDGKIVNLQNDKADKTALAVTDQNIVNLQNNKASKTALDVANWHITNLQNDKVNKTQTIIGLDLQDNILIGEFKTALGNATQSVAGLLSAEDKTHLDGLVALLENSDGNTVVDTIGEILAIFNNYPEGADLVTALNGKVDKVSGKGLSQNDLTDILKANLLSAYGHSQTVNSNPHQTTYQQLLDKPTTIEELGVTNVYNKEYIDALKDKNGWESELLGTLSNNETIALSIINQYDEIQMYAKDTLGVIDHESIRPSLMQTGDSVYFFDDTQAFIMVDTDNFVFYAPAGSTLQVVGLKYTDFTAEEVSFENTESEMTATTVQGAIDELYENVLLSTENDWDLETIFTEKFPNCRNGWVQVDNEIYVFGGIDFLGTEEGASYSNEFSKKSYKYNIITKQWTELAQREYNYNEERAIYKDGFIYLFGASTPSGIAGVTSEAYSIHVCQKYEIATNTFTMLADAPFRIVETSGAVLVDNKIYVFVDSYSTFNGLETPVTFTDINTTPYVYDIATNTWEVKTPANIRFDRGFATYYDGLIYVQRSLKFQAYNPTADTWITDLTPPTYGVVHTGLIHEYKGRLFFGSGWESIKGKNNPFIQYYDVAKDKWFVATRLEFKNDALGYGSMFLYDNKLYYIGGYSNEAEPNFNNVVRSFDLEKLQFEEIDTKENLSNKAVDFSVVDDTKYPTTKAVSERLLNLPIAELNNHTLCEVFEDNNKYLATLNASDYETAVTGWGVLSNVGSELKITRGTDDNIFYGNKSSVQMTLNNGSLYYVATYIKSNVSTNLDISLRQSKAGIIDSNVNVGLISSSYGIKSRIATITDYLNARILQFQITNSDVNIKIYHNDIKVIDLTSLGISSLTVKQMDYWFSVYQGLKTSETNAIFSMFASKQQEAWITPTLVNGWVNTENQVNLQYKKSTLGVVYLRGTVSAGTATQIMTLPSGYRPSGLLRFPVCFGVSFGTIDISAGGQISVNGAIPFVGNLLINVSFIAEA